MRHDLAPIVVFAFNRPGHLRRTLEALSANTLAAESAVTIFCDGPRTAEEHRLTDAVRSVARSAKGFATLNLVERSSNLGCAGSVMDGLTQMFSQNEKVIVIEDDILTSPFTLSYLNTALEHFRMRNNVFSISAWAPPPTLFRLPQDAEGDIYYVPRFHCWGWASWRDRFERVDWAVKDYVRFNSSPYLRRLYAQQGGDLPAILDAQMAGNLNTWDIQTDFSRFMRGMVCINPRFSYTTNIGMGSGTHTTEATTRYDNDLAMALPCPKMNIDSFYDYEVFHRYASLYVAKRSFKANLKAVFRRIKRKFMPAAR